MIQLLLIGILALFVLASVAFIMLTKEKKAKDLLESQISDYHEQEKLMLYELTVLKNIQEDNQSRLDVEKVIDVVAQNLGSLIPHSLISALILKHDKLLLKTTIKEQVNHTYLDYIK